MVREADHMINGVISLSSIALLQERFRQLEKMKELRQEKELLRLMLSEYSPPPITVPYERQTTTFSSSEQIFLRLPRTPIPHCQLSLSLWPDSESEIVKQDNSRGMDHVGQFANLAKSCFAGATLVCASESSDSADIDTSLRL